MKYYLLVVIPVAALLLGATGCGNKPAETPKSEARKDKPREGEHSHGEGANGGVIFELGKYHGEFLVDHAKKEFTILIINGHDKSSKTVPVSATEFTVTTKETKTKDGKVVPAMTVKLLPVDAKDGKASKFVGTDPGIGNIADFEGTVIGLIDGKPSQGEFKEEAHDDKKAMGGKVDPMEAEIYLKSGGIYTESDIKANGATTVSVKYKNLKVSHDIKPKKGDKLCPITLTKANPELVWIIDGKKYEFCCPPCVDEFVTLAKTKPGDVKAPEKYIKE